MKEDVRRLLLGVVVQDGIAHRPKRVRRVDVLVPVRRRRVEAEMHRGHARSLGTLN
jgi:hypothetical protein